MMIHLNYFKVELYRKFNLDQLYTMMFLCKAYHLLFGNSGIFQQIFCCYS